MHIAGGDHDFALARNLQPKQAGGGDAEDGSLQLVGGTQDGDDASTQDVGFFPG